MNQAFEFLSSQAAMSTEVSLASCLDVDYKCYIFIFPNWGLYLLYMQKKAVHIIADNL